MRGQSVVRRIIVFVVLFALVVVAAIGLAGLVSRAFETGAVLVDGSGSALARSVAFSVIATPLAALLWWWEGTRLAADPDERSSVAWGLYLFAMALTALVTATIALGDVATAALAGVWQPGSLATGIVWAGVWMLHRALRRSPTYAPARLGAATVVASAVWGLALAMSGAITALGALVSEAVDAASVVVLAGDGLWRPIAQGLVWVVLGAAVWVWHRRREGADDATGGFAAVVLVVVTAGSAAVTLFASGTVLHVLLRLLLRDGSTSIILSPSGPALAAALVGGIVWAFYTTLVRRSSSAVRTATRLAVSGIALVGAASGFGVVVNALLASLTSPLVETSPLTLLLAGLSALVVGAPAWWIAWRPVHAAAVATEVVDDRARRVYLVVVFGTSAVAAIIAVLTLGYRLLAFLFEPVATEGLVDVVRAPLGVLVATALVFAYHFTVWRRSRDVADAAKPALRRIVLVAEGAAAGDALAAGVREATGVPVTLWAAEGMRAPDDAVATIAAAAATIATPRMLVIVDTGGPRIIPLAE